MDEQKTKKLTQNNITNNNINLQNLNTKFLQTKENNYISNLNNKVIQNFIFHYNNYKSISNQKNRKKRNPGIDLVRLIGMFIIILNHLLYFGDAYKKFFKYKRQLKSFQIFIDWHNNGFALISGIVGYKTNKYSNLLYLWLIVHFYSVGVHLYIITFKKKFKILNDISIEFFPIVFKRYWYFTAYFGMYLYLPIINKGISSLSKFEFRIVVMSIIGILVLWKDFKNPENDVFYMKGGGSMIWLITFYLVGAYIGKYNVNYLGYKKYCFYFILSLILIFF